MKIGWNFPSNDNGCVNGVSEAGIETFRGDVFKSLAKEICQNSLDARLDDNKPVRIEFYLSNIDIQDIPDCERLQEVFILSKKYWEDNKKANAFYKKAVEILMSKKIRLLRISDFNTTGITGSREKKSSNWIDLVKSSGVSNKTGTAGGSYGIGKNAPFASSELRIVYYRTLDKDNIRAYQGVAKLASFEEERLDKDNIWGSLSKKKKKIMTQGIGFYGNIENNLPVFEDFSLDNFKRTEIGTDLYILGFVKDDDWKNEMIKSVLSSYLLSIYNGDLEIIIENILINKTNLEDLVQEYADDLTKDYYQVLCSPNTVHKEKEFAGLGNITLDILIGKDLNKRKVLMARGNGMKIFDKNRISSTMQFAGICILKDRKVDEYFRSMETQQHDKWEPNRHDNKKEAEKIIKELYKFIKDEIKDLGRNTILDEMDAVGASEYLPDEVIEVKTKEQNKKESLLNKTSSVSSLKKIEVITSNKEGTQIIDEANLNNGNINVEGEINDNGDLVARKKHNKSNKQTDFNVYEYFGIPSNEGDSLLENPSKIEPLSFRLFLYDKNNKEYKLSFVPKRSSCNSYIKIYLMGEQGSIPASVSTAYDSKKNKMSCKNNNIYIGDLIANQKYTIIYSIDNDELCSMEVSIHGYNK